MVRFGVNSGDVRINFSRSKLNLYVIILWTNHEDRKNIYILRLKCTKFYFGWGSAPDPAGGAHSAPPDPLTGFKGSYFCLLYTSDAADE